MGTEDGRRALWITGKSAEGGQREESLKRLDLQLTEGNNKLHNGT